MVLVLVVVLDFAPGPCCVRFWHQSAQVTLYLSGRNAVCGYLHSLAWVTHSCLGSREGEKEKKGDPLTVLGDRANSC